MTLGDVMGFRLDKLSPATYYRPIMASNRSQRRIERLLDEADEAAAHLDWETVRTRAQAVLGNL